MNLAATGKDNCSQCNKLTYSRDHAAGTYTESDEFNHILFS